MKRSSTLILLVLVGILVIFGFWTCGRYNSLVKLDEQCISQWAQVENVYQRRADIVQQMIGTIKGETNFEQETLIKVIEARASATQIKIDPSNMTEEQLRKWDAAQNTLGNTIGRLLMVSEQYPTLQANQGFRDLRTTIEGNENRITQERRKFIEVVQQYNTARRRFPTNLVASMGGFERRPTFESQPGTDLAPEVDFSK
jgi:LemA protein